MLRKIVPQLVLASTIGFGGYFLGQKSVESNKKETTKEVSFNH